MEWLVITIAAILAITIGTETKYSRFATGIVIATMLAAVVYVFAGLYLGWIEFIPAQQ